MYTYDEILKLLHVDNNQENKKYIKAIIHALVQNNKARIEKQKIIVDINEISYLWEVIEKLKVFFDYEYNTKIDLTKFLSYVINEYPLNLNAIFCPGYTKDGYKNYIGENNSKRLEELEKLKEKFHQENIDTNFHITLADIFLENIDSSKNPNWQSELEEHTMKFREKASIFFNENEIVFLSQVFSNPEYVKGFIKDDLLQNKTFLNFYKNNLEFYKKMNWSDEEIEIRNKKLFTIYTIISDYINSQFNGIYLPMETMYSRSKVMTENGVCTLFLYKK